MGEHVVPQQKKRTRSARARAPLALTVSLAVGASSLVADPARAADPPPAPTSPWTFERVSSGAGGTDSDGESASPQLSADGSHVVFESGATNLGSTPIPRPQGGSILAKDLSTGAVTQVSVEGTSSPLRYPWDPAVNADGSVVAFTHDVAEANKVIRRDRPAATSTVVAPFVPAKSPSIDDSGDRIAYLEATAEGNTDRRQHIWVHDTGTATGGEPTNTRVSALTSPDQRATDPVISGDGSTVAYAVDTPTGRAVHVVDVTDLAAVEAPEVVAGARVPTLDATGHLLVYAGRNATTRQDEVHVLDRESGVDRVVLTLPSGSWLSELDLSADGSTVGAVVNGSDGAEVWMTAVATGRTEVAVSGVLEGADRVLDVGTDGRTIVFASARDDLVAGDANRMSDVFVARRSDAAGPTWPVGGELVVDRVGSTFAAIGWPQAEDDVAVTGYQVVVGGRLVASLPATARTHVVSGLTPETDVAISVVAVDGEGNPSTPLSTTVTTEPRSTEPGTAGLLATPGPGGSVTLSWDPADGATGYQVLRVDPGGDEALPVADLDGATTSFTDVGLRAATTYRYRVALVDGGPTVPYTVDAEATTPALGIAGVSWRGSGTIGGRLDVAVVGEPGWQASVDVTSETWLAADGTPLDTPRTVTERLPAAEDAADPGHYLAAVTIPEGTARITAIEAALGDGADEVRAAATRLPLGIRAAASVTVVAPEGALPGARVVVDGVAQSPISGGAVWAVPAIPAGDRVIRVLSANGRTLATTTHTFVAGRTDALTLTPSIPGSLAVRVLDRDGRAVAGSRVTFTPPGAAGPLPPVVTDGLGLATLPADLDDGDLVAVSVTPPRHLPYETTAAEATVVAAGSVQDVALRPMATGGLTGTVTLDGAVPAVGAHVVASQTIGGVSRTTSAVTGPDGRYSLEGLAGPATVVVNYRQDPALTVGTVELGTPAAVRDVSLQQAGTYRLELRLLTRGAADPSWRPTTIDPLNASVLRVAVTVGGRRQFVQTGDLVVRAQPGEVVELCADGQSAGLTRGCSEVTLGDDTLVPVELRIESRAEVRATIAPPSGVPTGSLSTSVTVSKFEDGRPRPVFSQYVSNGQLTAPLPEPGRYHLQIRATTDGIASLSRTFEFDVADGEIVDLGQILLARTVWTEHSSITAVRPVVSPGAVAEVRASLAPSWGGTHEDVVARLTLPAGTTLLDGSVTVDGAPAEATVADGVVLVPLGDRTFRSPPGSDAVVVRARLATDGVPAGGAAPVLVDVTSTQSGVARTQHAGSVTVRVAGVTLSAPETSVSPTVELSGRAPAGALVTIREGNAVVGTTTATPGGIWFLTATLPDYGAGHEHVLVASAESDGTLLASTPGVVVVDDRMPVLERVAMVQSGVMSRVVEIDPMAGVARFPYVWRGPEGVLEVDATFGGRGSVEDVRAEVGATSAPAEPVGGGRYVADVGLRANDLGTISVDYEPIPAMAEPGDVPVLTEEQVAAVLPGPLADHGDPVVVEDHDPEANMRRAHITTPVPGLGPDGEMTTTLSVTRGVAYTPTPADVADAGRAGVPVYGLSYSVTRTETSLVITGSAYVPDDRLGTSPDGGAAVSSAFGVVRIGFQHAFTVGNSADNLLTAALAGDKFERIGQLSDWVGSNCSPANISFMQGQIEKLSYEALASDALHAGIMVAGLAAAPATFGIGTVGIWAVGFFLDKMVDLALQHRIDQVSHMASEVCRDDDDDPRDPWDPRDPDDPDTPADDQDGSGGSGTPVAIPTWIHDPSGYVFEAVPSNRVEGVTATLLHAESPSGPFEVWDADWYGQSNPLTTDPAGAYGWDVPEGWWQVVVSKDGYEAARSEVLEVLPPHFDVNLALVSRAAPSVSSVEVVGEPADAVEITFDRYVVPDLGDEVTVTRDDGSVVASHVEAVDAEAGPAGTFARTFRVVPDEPFAGGEHLTVTVGEMVTSYAGTPMTAASTTSLTVPLRPGVHGTVTGPDGAPLAGATVMAFADTDTWFPTATATTGTDGRYHLTGLPAGTYRLRYSGDGTVVPEWSGDRTTRADATPLTVTTGDTLDGNDAALTTAATITGTVTGPDGAPLAGATVMALSETDTWFPTATATTGTDGRYHLTGLPAGTYRLRYSGDGTVVPEWSGDRTTRADATPLTVTTGDTLDGNDAALTTAATITGTVTGPDGAPLAGATVMALSETDTWFPTATATTGTDGRYHLTGLPTGTYRVRYAAPGFRTEWHRDAATRRAATPVTLAGDAVTGMDAVLAR